MNGKSFEFHRGIKEIAAFLRVHPRTVLRHLKAGRIPALKDCLGRWVLFSDDYWSALGVDRNRSGKSE